MKKFIQNLAAVLFYALILSLHLWVGWNDVVCEMISWATVLSFPAAYMGALIMIFGRGVLSQSPKQLVSLDSTPSNPSHN